MKNKIKNQIIEEMNNRINEYVWNSDLFAGGCCYAAYVLAKNLKKLGITYKTVMFQYNSILNVKNFNSAINGPDGQAHVGIEVVYKHQKMIIGDCSAIYRYFECSGEKFKVRTYADVSPEEILEGYKNGSWNWRYNVNCNGPLMRDISRIADKYMEMYK